MPIAIRTIVTINVVVFLLQALGGSTFNNWVVRYFSFDPTLQSVLFQPWRMITYMFLHAGVFHILFNMLWLWWMGRAVEATLGPRTFTVIYLGSGIGGALLFVVFAQLLGINLVIGASGAVFGIMVTFAVLYPTMPIMLFLFPPIEARYVVAGLIALNVIFLGSADHTARMVHLGGALVGYLLIKAHYSGFDLSSIPMYFERWWYRLKAKSNSRPRNRNMRSVSDAEVIEEVEQSELDAILEKISQKGYDGLTDEEKRKLFELSKRG